MSFLELAQARYSERHFASTPLEPEKLEYILEGAALLPLQKTTSHSAFWLCKAREGLKRIDACTKCRFGAPCVLILAYDLKASAHNPDVVDYGIVDTSIVGTQISLAAEDVGIKSCWVGLIDPPELRRQFSIPASYRIVAVMPLGYPSDKSRPSYLHRRRKPLEETVFFEHYPQPASQPETEE